MAIHAHRPAVWCLRIASIVALVALFLPSTAHADSECKKGYRDFTAAERATMTSTLQRAAKTFPEPPAGWMRTLTHEDVSAPASLCRDVEQRPWEFNFTRHYNRIPDQDSDNKAIARIAASGQELQKKKQARLDALTAKLNKVSQQRVALITKGDMAGAEKFDPEVERLTAEIDKVSDEGTDPVATEGAEAFRDRDFSIAVEINTAWQTPGTGAQNFALPAGAHLAKHWTANDGTKKGDALVLLGDWKAGQEGRLIPISRAGVPMSGVHNVAIHISADENRLAAIVGAIDFAALAKLLVAQ